MQLEKRSREVDMLQERLDLEQFGRRRAQAHINSLLNDFVLSCLQIPQIVNDISIKEVFEELLSKSETLCEFGVELTAAVQVASEDSSRIDFLRPAPAEDEENATGETKTNVQCHYYGNLCAVPLDISLDQALEKISNLLTNEQRLRHEAKHQVIEQMRKQKVVCI